MKGFAVVQQEADIRKSAGAAGRGHLAIVKWLVEGEPACQWNSNALRFAARGGHLDAIQWLLGRLIDPSSYLLDTEILNHALGRGHIEVVKYLRELMSLSGRVPALIGHLAAQNG